MSIVSFGEESPELGYKTLDERIMRGSAGVMLLIGFIAFVNGFVIKNYPPLPYLSGFLLANFAVGVFINPKFAPTYAVARFMVRKQAPLPIGAIQKKFAWSLGMSMMAAVFGMSLLLVNDASWFDPVCMLCLVCLLFLYLETAFGICVGCKLYGLALRLGLMKPPPVAPNCMGDACKIEP
jgi:hypothetical protein